jgi:hypothetical protein
MAIFNICYNFLFWLFVTRPLFQRGNLKHFQILHLGSIFGMT